MKQSFGYGVMSERHLAECANSVCAVFGRRPFDTELCLETCAVESNFGTYKDSHIYKHGVGVGQIDEIAFRHIRQKYAQSAIAVRLYEAFGIDLGRVEYRELALNPLLCMVFVRFQYWQVKAPIPKTLVMRARYWKKHFNTELGKGTVRQYVLKAKSILYK